MAWITPSWGLLRYGSASRFPTASCTPKPRHLGAGMRHLGQHSCTVGRVPCTDGARALPLMPGGAQGVSVMCTWSGRARMALHGATVVLYILNLHGHGSLLPRMTTPALPQWVRWRVTTAPVAWCSHVNVPLWRGDNCMVGPPASALLHGGHWGCAAWSQHPQPPSFQGGRVYDELGYLVV